MSKDLLNKSKNILLILLTIGVFTSTYMLYQKSIEDEKQYESFLNRFYIQLPPIINDLEVLLSSNNIESEKYEKTIRDLKIRLTKLNTILEISDATVNIHIHDQPAFTQYAAYETLNDGENNEMFFKGLRKVLVFVREEMYSEETKQENPNLTIDEFNRIIKEGTQLYKDEI